MKETVSISVLVRCLDSEKTLPRLLMGLHVREDDEVLVVDSGSRDKTISIAESRGAKVLVAPPPFNYSKSLNVGFRAAKNEWVLVISSHSVPLVPDLLEVYRTAVAEVPNDVAAIYGPNTLATKTRFDGEPIQFFSGSVPTVYEQLCGNGNALYRRSAWERVPFEETVRTAEDKRWLDTILALGFEVSFLPAALTVNRSAYPLRYMFMKGYSDSRASERRGMTLRDFYLSLGTLSKLFLKGNMPIGNWVRYSAHVVGRYFGSRGPANNLPNR